VLEICFNEFCFSSKAVKEKLESKPRQPTIDLSQMAVPIQMTQEKRHSPESPSIAVVESELVAEYITTGKWLRQLIVVLQLKSWDFILDFSYTGIFFHLYFSVILQWGNECFLPLRRPNAEKGRKCICFSGTYWRVFLVKQMILASGIIIKETFCPLIRWWGKAALLAFWEIV